MSGAKLCNVSHAPRLTTSLVREPSTSDGLTGAELPHRPDSAKARCHHQNLAIRQMKRLCVLLSHSVEQGRIAPEDRLDVLILAAAQ